MNLDMPDTQLQQSSTFCQSRFICPLPNFIGKDFIVIQFNFSILKDIS